MDHVVPGQRRVRRFAGKAVEQEVGDQPRGVGGQMACRVEAVVAELRHDPRRDVQRHCADGPPGADQQRAVGARGKNGDAAAVFGDAQGVAAQASSRRHAGGEAAGDAGEAVRPSEQRAVGGVGGLSAAARKIVQAGPGGNPFRAGAVFVAADVVEPDVERRSGVALGGEPVAEGRGIQPTPGRVGGGLHQRHAEQPFAVVAPALGQRRDFGQEAPVLGGFDGADGIGREQAFMPFPGEEEALVGGMVDLGAIATEYFLLGIDPYPRKPGAVFDHEIAPPDPEDHPFAALKALKGKPKRKPKGK